MWSDPTNNLGAGEKFKQSERGAGVLFAQTVTQQFLDVNDIDQRLIRSHDVVRQGRMVDHHTYEPAVGCIVPFSRPHHMLSFGGNVNAIPCVKHVGNCDF